jgi:hypothetical protein
MNIHPYRLIKFCFILVLVVMVSCSKTNTEGKLVGTWKMIDLNDINNTTRLEKWEFTSDGLLYVTNYNYAVSDLGNVYKLRYEVPSAKKLDIYKEDTVNTNYCLKWEITKLNNDALVIINDNHGILTKELEKL